jgi:hypothetical protein
MEATEARRGYARVAAWDEGNLIQAMARLKNPTDDRVAIWREMDEVIFYLNFINNKTDIHICEERARPPSPLPPPSPHQVGSCVRFDTLTTSGLCRDCCGL